MKARSIIFSLLIFIAFFAYGQNGNPVSLITEISDSANVVTKSIIKDYNGIPISYIEMGGRHYFTVATQRSSLNNIELKKAEISNDYSVNDFAFHGEYLYCCGTYLKMYGFIGCVKISDFIENNSFDFKGCHYFVNQNNMDNYVKDLFKLVVYQYSDLLYVVSIGETINEYKEERGCVMAIEIPNNGVNIAYKVGESSSAKEKFNDIEVTSNYVVTVGSESSSPDAAIRRFPKNSILTLQPYSNDVYKYPTNEQEPSLHLAEDIIDFSITKVIGDTVAIASYWYIPQSANLGTYLRGTLLRLYNLTTPLAPTMMTSISINQNYYTGNWKLKELQYNDILEMFIILQDAEVSQTSHQSMVTKIDFNPLSVQSEYFPNIELSSLANVNGSMYYLASGYGKPNANKYFMVKNKLAIHNSNTICGTYYTENLSFKNIRTHKIDNIPLNTFGTNLDFIPIDYISINIEVFNNSCVKY